MPAVIDEFLPWYPIGVVVAIALGTYFTPILRDAARNFGIVDRPDGKLKTHAEPVAYLGGLAVYISFVLALGLMPTQFEHQALALMLGGSVVLILGLIDDLKALTPAVKLLGQLLAAFVLLKSGVSIHLPIPDLAAKLLTVLWVVTLTNAFNIIDVLDGLCAGTGAVCSAALFAIAVLNGAQGAAEGPWLPLFLACFAGSLVGFLRYNFRPAQIYLGDAGSMLIGFFIGSIAIVLNYSDANPYTRVAPLFLLAAPLFDLGLVIVLRLRKGLSPFRGSPDHFAVRLKRHGWSTSRIAITTWVANAVFAVFGIWLTGAAPEQAEPALIGAGLVIVTLGVAVARVGNSVPATAPTSGAPSREKETTPPRGA
jgi:UDP-GlcNAc:undecaprenyl-phosphate/decaprenyl-phosphate GlcNAc-1-phosphate transferase